MTNMTLFLIVITLTLVTSQTFQYSRGWTNGKRDGHRTGIERILTPCQLQRLKYMLTGKHYAERVQLLLPCDEDDEDTPKRYEFPHRDNPEAFQ